MSRNTEQNDIKIEIFKAINRQTPIGPPAVVVITEDVISVGSVVKSSEIDVVVDVVVGDLVVTLGMLAVVMGDKVVVVAVVSVDSKVNLN